MYVCMYPCLNVCIYDYRQIISKAKNYKIGKETIFYIKIFTPKLKAKKTHGFSSYMLKSEWASMGIYGYRIS